MRKFTFLFVGILATSISSFGQSLTLNQSTNLANKNIGEINSFLIGRNWKFHQKDTLDDSHFDLIWGYFTDTNESNKANAWYSISFKHDTIISFNYQFQDKTIYDNLLQAIKKTALKEGKTYILKSNKICTMYFGSKLVYMLCNSPNETENLAFELSIAFKRQQ